MANSGAIEIAGFVVPFTVKPDLVERLQNNWELILPNRNLHYGLGHHGYTVWETCKEPLTI